MESFFTDNKEPANKQVTSRKRARIVNEVDQELKQKARLYCSSAEQWKIVSRYSNERLRDFCDSHEFQKQSELHNTVFSFVQRALALAMDLVSGGDGYVQREIESDLSLRKSIELEAGAFVSLLSNKFQIVSLLAIDSTNGKLNQIRDRPPPIEITEVKNDPPDQCLFEPADFPGQIGGAGTTVCEETREISGPDCRSAADHDHDGPKRQREDHGAGEVVTE
jgi:hypothetical protein